ncbi:hypothetical protein [Priestia aryabhattai]|uniref:hypothetical protein n=1 Tax=Priestia aryabhattai TaxID=412384 RepID=UPI0015C6316A|nr:hypothetical protein [Priestia aryabhattai]
MDDKENAFLEDLKKVMIKHGVSLIITGHDGGIYCDDKKNFFSAEEASIHFDD